MIALILIALLATWAIYQKQTIAEVATDLPSRVSSKLDQLWTIAQEALVDRKYLRAEKALLTILRVDERNASAYNRLGILYAKQQAFKDAIECFEIAQSLEPSASSLHNVGLIYFETGNYEKAKLAFEQALSIDGVLASRHIAYAKVQEKLGDERKVVEALEQAVKLEAIPQTLNLLADAYERTERLDEANKMREKAAKMIIPAITARRVKQPRRVVM
jgi:tetratricopeptide (TPR) repeat protein